MAKDSQSLVELNTCVSSPHGSRSVRAATFREWMVTNQIGISLTVLAMLLAVHNLYPSLRPYTTPFFQLSYYDSSQDAYVQGWDDIYFVFSSILAFTGVRSIAIDWVFRPIARRIGLKKKASIRFAEQAWLIMYDGFFWCFGLYIWSSSSYWMDFGAIWADWPARAMSDATKWYLLAQLSFWIQQIIVVNIEERRKDHYQMLTHHFITSALLGCAYIYGFYNVSNVVLCLMDIVDILLPVAKVLKYLKYEMSCNVAFGIMMVTWLISRHLLYLKLCWSIYKNVPSQMAYGCYSGTTAELTTSDGYPDRWGHLFYPFQDINGPICMNRTIKWIFLSSLLSLQTLSLIWFGMIVRVAIGVLRTGNAEDTRSDDEEEEEEEEAVVSSMGTTAKEPFGAPPVAENSATDWTRSNGSVSMRTRGRGRGRVRLSDQSDRKALLGRIGCEKPTS